MNQQLKMQKLIEELSEDSIKLMSEMINTLNKVKELKKEFEKSKDHENRDHITKKEMTKQRVKRYKLCYNCRKKGHYANECPDKEMNKRQR